VRLLSTKHGVTVAAFVLAVGFGGLTSASAGSADWSISVSGELDGTAKKIKPQCLASGSEGDPLVARATFRLDKRRLRISIYFAAPVVPGSRSFGPTAGPSTVVVSISDASDPSATWVSATDGNGAVGDDRLTGTVDGTLAGAQGTIDVDASFACPKLGGGGSARGSGSNDGGKDEDAPSFSGSVEASSRQASTGCTATDTGTVDVFGLTKGRVLAAIQSSGSLTCEGYTEPSGAAAVLFDGTFRNKVLRLRVLDRIGSGPGTAASVFGCLSGGNLERGHQALKIRVRDGNGSAHLEYTDTIGTVFDCTITITRN